MTKAERIAAQHRAFEMLWLALRTDAALHQEALAARAGRQAPITTDAEAIKRAVIEGHLTVAEARTLKQRALERGV